MKKIKILSKDIQDIHLVMTLVQDDCQEGKYGIVCETDEDICFAVDISGNPDYSEKLMKKLFDFEVLPCTLSDIIRDIHADRVY